jgi:S-(hydroxymethyl)glutathione dehydrogenase/alcohol dehydrogenase
MTARIDALVVRAAGASPAVEELRLPGVGPGQVRVRVRAAGVCHSDLSMVNGTLKPPYPLVLGHEAAGEVVEVGDGVSRAAVGDHVALNWQPACRMCWFCENGEPWLCATTSGIAALENGSTLDGAPAYVALGLGAFADEVVVPENAVIGVPAELDWPVAALLGCAVLTGTGAVRNTARVAVGTSVVVIGLGGVGLSVVAAARAAGATPVIAVDVSEAKKALAEAAGATDFVVASDGLSKDVRRLTAGRGADHAFECVGRVELIRQAIDALDRHGQAILLGVPPATAEASFRVSSMYLDKSILGCRYGSSRPQRDIALYAELYRQGRLLLDELVTRTYPVEDFERAAADAEAGRVARAVLTF